MRYFYKSSSFRFVFLKFLIIITLVLCWIFLFLFPPSFFNLIKLRIYDFFLRINNFGNPPSDVVIVAIDEKSLKVLGRWPWKRKIWIEFLKKTEALQPACIAFDVIFSEKSPYDDEFAKELLKYSNVIFPVVFFFKKEKVSYEPPEDFWISQSLYVENIEDFEKNPPYSAVTALVPQPELLNSIKFVGHINIIPDVDGVVRKEVLYIEHKGFLIPSLSLRATVLKMGLPWDEVIIEGGKFLKIGNFSLPLQSHGTYLIPYYPPHKFPVISVVDFLRGKVPKNLIKNRVILVGATAVGIYDLRVTPVTPVMPGVEKHAHVITSLLQKRYIRVFSKKYLLVFITLSSLITGLFFCFLKPIVSFLVFLISEILFFLIIKISFSHFIWIEPFELMGSTFSLFVVLTFLNYFFSEKQGRYLKKVFSSYVTEQVVKVLMENPEYAHLGGERRNLTILFSDIRGFTSLSETLSPEDVVNLLNRYFEEMVKIIFKYEGTLDKFIGDAIMVFWGAPLPQKDHALRAVKCAMEMEKALRKLNSEIFQKQNVELRIGIGINTGEVLVGNIGVEGKKMDYTVIGDHVNLASRLEGLTKHYGVSIIFSEYTLEEIKKDVLEGKLGYVLVKGLDRVAVKGKRKPVKIYTILEHPEKRIEILEVKIQEVKVMKTK